MNSVLRNSYLLHEIFNFLEGDRKGCSSASLTCREFQRHAQAMLWRHIDSDLFAMLNLLSKLRSRDADDTSSKIWYLDGSRITQTDRDKLLSFGSYVHSVTNGEEKRMKRVKKFVYIAVVRALHGRLLFPNLRRVQINISCELHTICTAIPLLYSPQLIHVEIMKYGPYEPCWSKDASAFVQRLGLSGTDVRQLCIEAPLSQSAMDVLPSISNLSDIYLDADPNIVIKLPFLVFLSTLETLTDLHLRFYAADFESQRPRETLSFNKLKHASICCQFDDILTLLEFVRFPRIYTFAHEFDVPDDDENFSPDWTRYLNAVAKAGPKAKQLCLRPFRIWPPSLSMTIFDEGYPGVTFAPLLNSLLLFNLQVLRFDFDMINRLTQNDFERMILAWPNLKELDLRSTMMAEKSVDTSIFELIAKGFPNLLRLTICVDASQVEEATILVSTHPLESMDLTLMGWEGIDAGLDSDSEDQSQESRLIRGRLENTTKLAMLLDSWFPDLSVLETGLESCLPIVWECLRSVRLAERRRQGIEVECFLASFRLRSLQVVV